MRMALVYLPVRQVCLDNAVNCQRRAKTLREEAERKLAEAVASDSEAYQWNHAAAAFATLDGGPDL